MYPLPPEVRFARLERAATELGSPAQSRDIRNIDHLFVTEIVAMEEKIPKNRGLNSLAHLRGRATIRDPFVRTVLAREDPEDYYERAMSANDRINIDRRIHHGKPVIRGTRVPLTTVLGSLAGGMTFEEIQCEYGVTADDIRAALKFVSELADRK
jgi:uncharacterized protein (DUF433 family)